MINFTDIEETHINMVEMINKSMDILKEVLRNIEHGKGYNLSDIIHLDKNNDYSTLNLQSNKSGVYFIYKNVSREVMYVGESSNYCLKSRIGQHFRYQEETGSLINNILNKEANIESPNDVINYLMENCSIIFHVTGDAKSTKDNEAQTKLLEMFSILSLNPKYNNHI